MLTQRQNDDWTPLHFAARGGNLDNVKVLISLGADVFAKDKESMLAKEVVPFWCQSLREYLESY